MNVLNAIGDALQYLSDGVGHVFSLNHDDYPLIGVQPFDGEPLSQWVETVRH